MILFLLILNKSINIVSLCLSLHTTHFLQFLNVDCFESLSKIYKKQVKVRNKLNAIYVNKLKYLELLKNARKESMTQITIMFV